MLDEDPGGSRTRGASRALGVSLDSGREAKPSGELGGGTRPGLVPSAITSQACHSGLSELLGSGFPSAQMVGSAAALLESTRRPGAARGEAKHWTSGESITWRISVAPGLLRVSTRKVAADTVSMDQRIAERAADAWLDHDALMGELFGDDVIAARTAVRPKQAPRSVITEWSAKSRARMVATLASLDYAPLYADSSRVPAMVTLTLPGDWETVAPTGQSFKAMIKRWKTTYARAWGEPITGVWKLEFQRRGAPHLHIMMCPPHGRSADTGQGFRDWLSNAWAEAVGHPDPEERMRHIKAGTGIDYREGLKATDPKRMAIYFTKHSAPGGAASKEYQHVVPALWQEPGAGPGRFWGVWGLQSAETIVEVSPSDAITAARILRRHSRAQGLTRRVRVWRPRYDSETGELRGTPWRYSTVRAVRMQQGRGFVCLNDGPAMLSEIARYLDLSNASVVERTSLLSR